MATVVFNDFEVKDVWFDWLDGGTLRCIAKASKRKVLVEIKSLGVVEFEFVTNVKDGSVFEAKRLMSKENLNAWEKDNLSNTVRIFSPKATPETPQTKILETGEVALLWNGVTWRAVK